MMNFTDKINELTIDGHIHLFDGSSYLDSYDAAREVSEYFGIKKFIGFIDIPLNKLDKCDIVGAYEDFIKKFYDSSKHVLLASAVNADDVIKIYEDHSDIIRGFGEFKLYENYRGEYVGLDKVSEVRKVCRYSSVHGNLPIYIHYSLINSYRIDRLRNILKDFPTVPIVLCHCGMAVNSADTQNDIYRKIIILQHEYSNLWIDISFSAARFFVKNPLLLTNLCLDRCFLGSDLNPNIFSEESKKYIKDTEKYCADQYENILLLNKYIPSDKNLKALFKLS